MKFLEQNPYKWDDKPFNYVFCNLRRPQFYFKAKIVIRRKTCEDWPLPYGHMAMANMKGRKTANNIDDPIGLRSNT
jgi:hypothetical protein